MANPGSGTRYKMKSRSDSRSKSRERFNRDSERPRSFGGRGRFGDRDSRRPELFKVTCDKCGEQCEVPFRPTGDKPVYCSSCFKQNEGRDFAPRGRERRPERNFERSPTTGNSSESLSQINVKLDKILAILKTAGLDSDEVEESEDDEE